MTWAEWLSSEYNTDGLKTISEIDGNQVGNLVVTANSDAGAGQIISTTILNEWYGHPSDISS